MTTLSPLQLFREPHNMDTMQIAAKLEISEAEVEKRIHALREAERVRGYRRDYMRRQRAEARA